jgi:hypothetical protein
MKAIRMLRAAKIAIGFFVIALVLGVFWSSSFFQTCVNGQQSAYSQEGQRKGATFVGSDIGAIAIRCAGHVTYEYRDAITAVATVFIALFTLTLWLSTKKMMAATKAAVDLASKEFIATHTKVIVRFIQGPFHDENNYEFVWVTLANIGETDAKIVAIGCDLARRKGRGAWLPPGVAADPTPVTPTVLVSGERFVMKAMAQLPTGEKEIFTEAVDESELCAVGCIKYRDGNGRLLETGFLRIHDGKGNFLPSDNPEDEYQD